MKIRWKHILEKLPEVKELVRLIKCEFKKIKRNYFIFFITIISMLFPIPVAILMMMRNIESRKEFDLIFGCMVTCGAAIVLPLMIGIFASMLFFIERENDTLKNWRVIPISIAKMFTAKIIVVFFLSFLYSLTAIIVTVLLGVIVGVTMEDILLRLGIIVITNILYLLGTFPILIVIVYLNKTFIFSVLLTVFYTFFNFAIGFVLMSSKSPIMKILINIIPTAIIYRGQMSSLIKNNAIYFEKVDDYFLPFPIVILILSFIGVLSYILIIKIYKKRER